MAPKKTYWLVDEMGVKALVEGAEERDRLLPLGWAETDEPADTDWVWMRHAEHGGPAKFRSGVAELWEPKGWQLSGPPEPADPYAPQPVGEPTAQSGTTKTTKAEKATSSEEK